MSMLDELSNDELFTLIEANKLKELNEFFLGEKLEKILAFINQIEIVGGIKHHSAVQSVLTTLIEGPSYPLYILATILNIINIGFLPLSVITFFILLSTFGMASIYSYTSYQEHKKQCLDDYKALELTFFKNKCADQLLSNLNKELSKNKTPSLVPTHLYPYLTKSSSQAMSIDINKNKIKQLPLIKNSLGTGLLMGSVLFGSYYLSSLAVIAGFGLSALSTALTGPIGLGITLGFVLGASSFFAYKHYQHFKQKELLKKELKNQQQTLNLKYKWCCKIKEKLTQLKFAHPFSPEVSPTQDPYQGKHRRIVRFNLRRDPGRFFNNKQHLSCKPSESARHLKMLSKLRHGHSRFR